MRRKEKGLVFCSMILIVVFLVSCGRKDEKYTSSNHPVSGAAVSGSGSVAMETGELSGKMMHRFATDTNFYLPSYGEKRDEYGDKMMDGFECRRKDDVSKKEKIKISKFKCLLTVTEDSVYYLKKDNTLWRMPIEKDEKGADTLQGGEEEQILEEKEGIISDSGSFVFDTCIVYVTYEGNAVKYDWKKEEKSIHKLHGNIATLVPAGEDCLIVGNMYGGYFQWDIKTDMWTQFSDDGEAGEGAMAMSGDFFFYSGRDGETGGDEICRYNTKTRKAEVFLSEKQLDEACEAFIQEQGGEFKYLSMWQIFCHDNRLYVEVQIDWRKDKQYRMNYVTFCVDLAGEKELCVDRDWMDYVKENSKAGTIEVDDKIDECGTVVYNASNAVYLVDGKVIMILWNGDKNSIGCYDLEKKTGKIIERKSAEYYYPYYDIDYSEVYPEWYMEEGMNFVPEALEDYWID